MKEYLKELGFDTESEAFRSAWFNDVVFNRAIQNRMSLPDICILLSNARLMEQAKHIKDMQNDTRPFSITVKDIGGE